MRILSLTYNPFSENTILLIGEKKSCFIIDPGMMDMSENSDLFKLISDEGIIPKRLLLTHCHIDHVLGIKAVHEEYGLSPECHKEGVLLLEATPQIAQMYGIPYFPGPEPAKFLDTGVTIDLDGEQLEIRYVPGHAPGHIVFIHHASKMVVAGDTLFRGSIGRTDLPGGDHDLFIRKLKEELLSLPDDYTVWPGHGPTTNIGYERKNNPFLHD
ncbi:MAG: MBL fold metallo-hydrolase [Flavobacteriales bacterium]|nr:MBL fold metallo-hydrolase [Flavobacteriales bacterium]